MGLSDILIIDGNKFYWDINNECLIPYELIDDKKNSNSNNNSNTNSQEYLTHSINLYEKTINNVNNDANTNANDNIGWEWYMENYDIDFWENVLGRKLDCDERKLIHGIWNENSLNLDIKMLQKSIIQNHCYIKSITTNVGNCLFESIASLGLGDNDLGIKPSEMIRKNLAALLLSVKTEVGFFPNLSNLTPEEIFLNQNEIEMIKDTDTNQIYVYDYDMMIYDLNSNYSWTRLPMEFLLMAISRIYQVEILIYHNKTNYINKINVWDKIVNNVNDIEIEKIRLGQINEEHYFPLLELVDELKSNPDVIDEILGTEIKYDKYIQQFKKWSKVMMESIGMSGEANDNETKSKINNKTSNDKFKIDYNVSKLTDIQEHLNVNENQKSQDTIIMKTNKYLSQEQIDDYNQISNFDDFSFV
jgi:hypothetical protein